MVARRTKGHTDQRICTPVFEVMETVKLVAMSHVVELSELSPICSVSNSWIFVEIFRGAA